MKKKLAKYLLYIYKNYIIEDFDDIKKGAIPFFKVLSFFRKILVWIAAVVFFPIFVFIMVNEKELKEAAIRTENMFNQMILENKKKK